MTGRVNLSSAQAQERLIAAGASNSPTPRPEGRASPMVASRIAEVCATMTHWSRSGPVRLPHGCRERLPATHEIAGVYSMRHQAEPQLTIGGQIVE